MHGPDESEFIPTLHEIQERNRQRAVDHVLRILRLPPDKAAALREDFDQVLAQIRHEIRVQVGTIISERFEFDVIEEHLRQFAMSIGTMVDGQRVTEGLNESKELVGTMLSAAIGGGIGGMRRP